MRIKVDNQEVSSAYPLFDGQEVVVAIDSSKRNSAFSVGSLSREVLHCVEFDGSDDGTSERDTLVLCLKQRKALKEIFRNANVKIVGIEDIVTKHQKGSRDGMTEHMSRFKITAVFMSFISFFQDCYDITPELVNNWAWKSMVLPESFRSKEHRKGSLDYFTYLNSPYQYYTDDVTDSLCILEYLYITHDIKAIRKILKPEMPKYQRTVAFITKGHVFKHSCIEFETNKNMTVEQNADVMVNSLDESHLGVATVRTEDLSLNDIYGYCKGRFDVVASEMLMVVQRRY